MSDWGADEPDDLADGPGPVASEVTEARAARDAARAAYRRAAARRDDARDRLADAEGALRVAQAKAEDYDGDSAKSPWQRTAAAEGVEKARRELDRHSAALPAAEDDLTDAALDLERADKELAQARATVVDLDHGSEEPAQLHYGSVDEFVRENLRFLYRRRIDGRSRVWAGQWWRYAEAVCRLEALWRAWEHLRQDPSLGMSTWWRDHADHHMAALMDPDGPFADAIEGEENLSRRGDPLPYIAPPEGLFPDVRKEPRAGEAATDEGKQ